MALIPSQILIDVSWQNALNYYFLLNKRRFETFAHLKAIANEDKRSAASIRDVI